MPPHTPRSKGSGSGSGAGSGNHLTPSFSFGFGLLPSFKFASPRNLSLLSSLSPHRFLNRFAKKDDDNNDNNNIDQIERASSRNSDLFALFSPKNAPDSFEIEKKKFDMDADLICTGDSVDLWSLTNDTQAQNVSVNLTSIHEEGDTKDSALFLSPEELFLQSASLEESPRLKSSPILATKNDKLKTPSRKRRLSDVAESPCKAMAIRIEDTSPRGTGAVGEVDASKIWTSELDDLLLACYLKYVRFRDSQPLDSAALKYTSQNKVLSRMLFNKSGVERTAKQISSRLFRLNKSRLAKLDVLPVEDTLALHNPLPAVLSSPEAFLAETPLHVEAPHLTLEDLTLAFVYKLPIQCEHNFARLGSLQQNSTHVINVSEAKKALMITNARLSSDFDHMCDRLMKQGVPIHSVRCDINFRPNDDATSTPTSPLTNPRSFSIENGDFLSHLHMRLAPNVLRDDFLSWKSCTSIYKDDDKILLRSKELINGYRNDDGTFQIQVPFLNNFWAGYLTFLSNGSKAYNDIKKLHIVQVIYDGDDLSYGNVHGYFTYRFDIADMGQGNVSVSHWRIRGCCPSDIDDNATVLASPSPTKPERTPINTNLATNAPSISSSVSIPTYDASLLQKYNPNYSNSEAVTPGSARLGSVNPAYRPDMSRKSSDLNTPVSVSTIGGRQPSAGQIINVAGPMGVMPQPPHMDFPHDVPNGGVPFGMLHPQPQPTMYPNFVPPFAQGQMVNDVINDGTTNLVGYNPMLMPGNMPPAPMLSGMVPPQQWGMMFRPEPVMTHPSVNSAPASQIQFFPQNAVVGEEPKGAGKSATTITFGPIIGYDPSKDLKEHSKRSKPAVSMHKFHLNRQVMYKPKKK